MTRSSEFPPSVVAAAALPPQYPIPATDDEIDYSDIEARFAVKEGNKFDTVIIIDGAPIVDASKQKRLEDHMKNKFKNIGTIKELVMPFDPKTERSQGFLFMEFERPEEAALAVKYGDGLALDTKHTLSVNLFEDYEKIMKIPDTFVEPVIAPFEEKPHLRSWLIDDKARDQWVLMKGEDVGIYWNNKSEQPDLVHSRASWSDTYVAWSPLGTYLATFHKQGVALWGGPGFEKIVRFPHPSVKLIDFSPDEKYIVTWSHDPILTESGEQHHIVVWDVLTGLKLRSFPVDTAAMQSSESKGGPGSTVKIEWPFFKWSHDSKYVARMTPGPEGMISVYETPKMGLLDKKSIKIENIKGFEWSPTENVLSYWTPEPEVGNIPARVTLMKVPSREILRTKNLFNVTGATLHWQSDGKFLLVKVERAKTKKQTVSNLEIFRVKEKDVPVDVLDLKANETVVNVFWEPKGDKFAIITAEGGVAGKFYVHFYEMNGPVAAAAAGAGGKKKSDKGVGVEGASSEVGGAKLLRTLERKGINQVVWSPKGRIAVLAGVRAFQGDLEFWDVEDMILLGSGEHYMCTDVEWDPSGRYLTSSVSWWRVQTDPGFYMWSCTGQQLTKQGVTQFKQFLWRPRPPTPLSVEEQKKIKKNLKEFSKEFDEVDAKHSNRAQREVIEKRERLWSEWVSYRRRCEDDWKKEKGERIKIVGYDMEDEGKKGIQVVEELVDEVIDEVEEILESVDEEFDEDEDYGDE
ncbi:Translation initiation factor 3 subunit b [Blyttiomyces sp. JEL0837]|nr:Translation initiation factor 3 subunit b [Blyttiomyces sp. JEL0837]